MNALSVRQLFNNPTFFPFSNFTGLAVTRGVGD